VNISPEDMRVLYRENQQQQKKEKEKDFLDLSHFFQVCWM
jgi:hypothetical protein